MEENILAVMSVLESIGIIVVSIGIGCLYYYVMSPVKESIKRKQLNDGLSLLINFIIYIWIGKILANVTTFIKDPFAVLAYPSDGTAFYIATGLLMINIIYKKRREKVSIVLSLYLFLPIFLAATFTYEMIQWIVNNQTYNLVMLLFVTLLLLIYTLKKEITKQTIIFMTFISFIGLFIISLASSIMTLFGYLLAPFYYIVLCLLLGLFIYFEKRTV